MKPESLAAAREVYRIESDSILKALDYFDEVPFARAVEAAQGRAAHRDDGLRAFRHHLPAFRAPAVLHRAARALHFARRGRPRRDGVRDARGRDGVRLRGGKTAELDSHPRHLQGQGRHQHPGDGKPGISPGPECGHRPGSSS